MKIIGSQDVISIGSIFDEIVDRKNTCSLKWDHCMERFGAEDILPMWVADMDFKSPPQIIEAIVQRAEHGVFGYTEASDGLSEALMTWLKSRHGWDTDKRWILHSPGVVTSVNIAILAFTRPGDGVLMQTPIYYPFYSSIRDNGRRLVSNPLINRNGFYEMDFDDLEEKFKSGVKLMVLCSPHNPIGRVWRKADLEEVARLSLKYGVFVVSDEIHSDLVLGDFSHIPFGTVSEKALQNSISLYSPTKTFNIASLSQSSVIIPDRKLRKKFRETLNRNGAGMLNIFGMIAGETAYSHCEDWLMELLVYLRGNLGIIKDYFQMYIPQIKVIEPEATYLAWLDCNRLPVEAEKLKDFFVFKARVGLNEGSMFGKEGRGFQRMNFACPKARLMDGLERIRAAVESIN